MCVGLLLHVQCRYCWQVLVKVEFSRQLEKNVQIPNFMKILRAGAETFHADRRTDVQQDRHDEANTGFS
jgi:hypothetical protein